jgi:hypothetical protein
VKARIADATGLRTWRDMGWEYAAATRRLPDGSWADALGFSTAEESAEWKRLVDEEAALKAHEEFMAQMAATTEPSTTLAPGASS